MPAATSGARRTSRRWWGTFTRCGTCSGGGATRSSSCRSGSATSAGSPASGAPTWSSTSAKGSTATPGSRTTSWARSSSPGCRSPAAGTGRPPSPTGSTSPTRCSRRPASRCPPSRWPRATRPRPTSRSRPSSSRRRRTPAWGSTTARSAPRKRALKKRVAQMLEQFEEVLVQEYVAGPGVQRRVRRQADAAHRRDPVRRDARGYLADRRLRRQVDSRKPRGRGHHAGLPGRGARRARRPHRQGGPGRLGVRLRRRGLRPGGPPGQRGGPALRARGQSLPRPLQQRRARPHGPGLRLELRRPGACTWWTRP